jgi:dihydropyrimidinase
MLELVVRSDQVVTPHGVGAYDIAIQGEQIVAVAAPGTLSGDVGRTIDATGKIVVPGGIDPHTHCKWYVPQPDGTMGFSAGPAQVSRAALFGGTTTLLDFAAWEGGTLEQTIARREQDWAGQCYTDYAYHVMLLGALSPEVIGEIPETIQAGFPSFKMFTTNITPSRSGRRVLFGHIWEVFQQLARNGGIATIHAEDDDIVMHMYDKLIREGRTGFENLHLAHNALSEDISFRRVIRLAELVEGSAVYFVHVSAASGVSAIAESRGRGFPIYGETLHQYALHNADDYKLPNGQIYHTYPSLKSETDRQALWRGMATGTIGTVATDEVCTTLKVKTQGQRIDDCTGGNSGVEPRMGVIYTEGVVNQGFSLERFVNLTSANAARILGLYPRKGAIAPGSDADLAIIDPNANRALREEELHETDYSPWNGWQIAGWPIMTILRGTVAVEKGQLLVEPTHGKRLLRKVPDIIRSGPAC